MSTESETREEILQRLKILRDSINRDLDFCIGHVNTPGNIAEILAKVNTDCEEIAKLIPVLLGLGSAKNAERGDKDA